MLKPPAALMPGMAGGDTTKTRASGIFENAMFSFRMIASDVSSGPSRSSQGANPMKPVPV